MFTTILAFDGINAVVRLTGSILSSPVTTFVLKASDLASSVQPTAHSAGSVGTGPVCECPR